VEAHVRAILQDYSGLGDAAQSMGIHENLWRTGMTSLASVQVMLALEATFGFEFPESKLRHATFSSIHAIVATVQELAGSTVR
jgi:acyl carrier protein